LGSGKMGNILQVIWDLEGPEATTKFINDIQRLTNNFNLYYGFSVGIVDTMVEKDIRKQIDEMINTLELKIEHKVTEVENNPSIMTTDNFETMLLSENSVVKDDVAKIVVENEGAGNNFGVMLNSGSKGDSTNTGQICGCLGLQQFEGKMMPKKYNNRTLAYFHENDDRCASRGFVKRSFTDGLSFSEFVYALAAGRAGLIDQAIKTGTTGYIQRKLVKMLEDETVKYDGTVRNASNSLLQVVYGDSGADTTKQYQYTIKLIRMSNNDIKNKLVIGDDVSYYNFLVSLRDKIREKIQKATGDYIVLKDAFMIPINLQHIINDAQLHRIKNDEHIDAAYVMQRLNNIIENCSIIYMSNAQKNNKNSLKYRDDIMHKFILEAALHDAMSPKRVIEEYKIGRKQFDEVINNIEISIDVNSIEPGECVGIIAAESMGEPLTQCTLNSFHHAGVASLHATTQGVPRMKELFGASKNIKTPQMVIYINKTNSANVELARKISSQLRYTTIGDIRGNIEVYYDPDPMGKDSITLSDNVKCSYFGDNSEDNIEHDIKNLPWLFKIIVDKDKMLEEEITLLDIKSKFCNWWNRRSIEVKNMKKEEKVIISNIRQLEVLSNSNNDIQPVIHIRFSVKNSSDEQFNFDTINKFANSIIDNFKLKGIKSIDNITVIKNDQHVITFNDNTGEILEGKNAEKECVIYTLGVNMMDIRYLSEIDIYRTVSNDVFEMYNIFGIEIARAILLKEITSAFSNAGSSSLNYQHILLVADIMTSSGTLTSIDRHGMNRSDGEPLARASFEETVEQLLSASLFSETDHINGISSCIMTGSSVRIGTGLCNVVLDTEMLEKSEVYSLKQNDNYVNIASTTVEEDIINQHVTHGVFIPQDDDV